MAGRGIKSTLNEKKCLKERLILTGAIPFGMSGAGDGKLYPEPEPQDHLAQSGSSDASLEPEPEPSEIPRLASPTITMHGN